jgi:hypothetical protein
MDVIICIEQTGNQFFFDRVIVSVQLACFFVFCFFLGGEYLYCGNKFFWKKLEFKNTVNLILFLGVKIAKLSKPKKKKKKP